MKLIRDLSRKKKQNHYKTLIKKSPQHEKSHGNNIILSQLEVLNPLHIYLKN